MDRRPQVETRPPALIEAVVRLSVPAPCREHVVGDLWERYRSPTSFLYDALRTVPFVVASQIRRTSTIGFIVIQAFVLTVGFGVGAGRIEPPLIAVAAGLIGLVLRDAYKHCVSLTARQISIDLAVGVASVLACESLVAVVRPDLLLPAPAWAAGALSFGMLFLVRLQNPGLGAYPPRGAVAVAPASLEALLTEVRLYERMTRRALHIEMWTGIVVAAVFIAPLLLAPNWALRVGWALVSTYGLYVAGVMWFKKPQPMPDGLGFDGAMAFYRDALERQCGFVRTMWQWYLLPFAPSMLFIMLGGAMDAAEHGRPLWPAAAMGMIVAIIGVAIHLVSRNAARKLCVRIDSLHSAQER